MLQSRLKCLDGSDHVKSLPGTAWTGDDTNTAAPNAQTFQDFIADPNFFLWFTSWFGSTHYTVTGDLRTAWTAAGGANGVLGNPAGNAVKVTSKISSKLFTSRSLTFSPSMVGVNRP